MKKILVPTDLSEIAERGLQLAVEIGKRCGASITLVNFTRHPLGSSFTATADVTLRTDEEENAFTVQLLKTMQEKMEALVARYHHPNLTLSYAILDNKFKHGIDEYLQAENVDLVVMGTSGEETSREAFTGNHTEQIIRISPCPVLSVRDAFDPEDFRNIVVAADLITDNKLADALGPVRDLATCFQSHIHLVHVRSTPADSNLLLDQYFTQMARIANLQHYTITILDAEDSAEAVMAYADRVEAGLVAVVKNRKEGIFRIFSNRFSNRLVKEEGRPVITVNLKTLDKETLEGSKENQPA